MAIRTSREMNAARRLCQLGVALILCALLSVPAAADAHDDPVVTVRVMCDGFNSLDMTQVLGELSDAATITLDGSIRGVQGGNQIETWVKQQMDKDLRIEIVDMGVPQQLPDGYRLAWTGRFSRQDWRQSGIAERDVASTVEVHNGRITTWTAVLDSGLAVPAIDSPAVASDGGAAGTLLPLDPRLRIPVLFGIPVTLLLAGLIAVVGGTVLVRGMRHD